MPQSWYLTPGSINYLAEAVLSLVISVFITALTIRERKSHGKKEYGLWLVAYFWLTFIINALSLLIETHSHLLNISLLYLRRPFNDLCLLLLLQFAYYFPAPARARRRERIIVQVLSLLYWLYEIVFVLCQLNLLTLPLLIGHLPDVSPLYILLILSILAVFIRQQVEAANLRLPWWQVFARLPRKQTRAVLTFLPVVATYFSLGPLDMARMTHGISEQTFNITVSSLMLVVLLLLAILYLESLEGPTSFLLKLVGIGMVTSYSIIGITGWLLLPALLNTSSLANPFLSPHTIQFQAVQDGGYQIRTLPFHFDTELGDRLALSDESSQAIDLKFPFPFNAVTYTQVYVADNGFVSFGHGPTWYERYALDTRLPRILVFLMNLDPQTPAPGGVYVRNQPDSVLITWYQLALHGERSFSFQLALYPSGTFDLTFEKLPLGIADILAIPTLNSVTGIATGSLSAAPREVDLLTDLPLQLEAGAALVDNPYLRLRAFIHQMMLPLMYLLGVASLFSMLIFPLFSWITLIQPLNVFLDGVKRVNQGDLTVDIPVYNHDEIGFLAETFTRMVAELRHLVTTLERRVSERTRDLEVANRELLEENQQREAAEEMNLQQQRLLAMLEERERIGRDLHDGLGQKIGYINVEAQAAREFLLNGQDQPAQKSLEKMSSLAKSTLTDIRQMILGLRSPNKSQSFLETLELYLDQLHKNYAIQTNLSLPVDAQFPEYPPLVEDQILRILQEALTNVQKHAAAQKVEILFNFGSEYVQIIVSDDGQGFDLNPPLDGSRDGHFGLEIMRERARLIGGKLEFRSKIGAGAKVLLEVPLHRAQTAQDTPAEESASPRALRLMLVDDSSLFMDGLRNLLQARGYIVVGEAHDGLEALRQARALRPDLILMDVNMPNLDGLEATRAIKAELPETKILILTVSENEDILFEAVRSGASGYLLKSLDVNELVRQLVQLGRGETPLTSGLALRLMQKLGSSTAAPSQTEALTRRQREILQLVSQGLIYKQIAAQLNVSEGTVKREMGEALKALHLENRRDALKWVNQSPAPPLT